MAVAIPEASPVGKLHLSKIWHRAAPHDIVVKYQDGDASAGWKAWQKHLRRRRRPKTPQFLSGRQPPLLWGWPDSWQSEELKAAMRRPIQLIEQQPFAHNLAEIGVSEVVELLAIAYALPQLTRKMSADSWWALTNQLVEMVGEMQPQIVDCRVNAEAVLRQQLLAGELPLALSYLFPELTPMRELRQVAQSFFSESLLELTDGEGLPHARLLPVFGMLFACWTRARWLGERLEGGSWSPAAEVQYKWLVRQALRLVGTKHRFRLASLNGYATQWCKPLFSTALELAGDSRDAAAAAVALPGKVLPRKLKRQRGRLPKPSLNSDWSGISVLATDWSRSAVKLAASYADEPVQIELSAAGKRFFAGPWKSETRCDDKPVRIVGEWENLCWQSDKRCDLLELGVELSEGLRLERQVLLGKQDRVLYIAEMIFAADGVPRRIEHSVSLPLDPGARWIPDNETRDGLLHAGGACASVLPISLGEWRSDPRGGELVEQSGRLVFTQQATGRALCCALFFDLDSTRAKEERTWRQLTIAEWMEVIPRDMAVGFRAQSGGAQWLFYRSLGPAGNRTVLGQNIAGEFCAGRFRSTGKFDDWIEIEAV